MKEPPAFEKLESCGRAHRDAETLLTMQNPSPPTRSRQGSSSQYQAWSCTVGVCNGVAGVRPAPAAKAATHAPIGMLRSHAPPTHEMKMPVSTDPLPSTASSGRVLQWGRAQQVSGRLGGYRFMHAAPCPASNAHWPKGNLRRAMHRGHHLKVAPLGDSVSKRVSVHHHLWGKRKGGGGRMSRRCTPNCRHGRAACTRQRSALCSQQSRRWTRSSCCRKARH